MAKRFFGWIFRGTAKRMSQWFGWGIAKDFYQECQHLRGKTDSGFLSTQKMRFQENLRLGNDLHSIPFDDLLEQWGIYTTKDFEDAVQAIRRSCLAGIILTGIFGTFCLWQIFSLDQTVWWRTLHGFAGLSFLLSGILRWVTATWRLRVFQHKTFVPFVYWMSRLGNVSWR